MEAIMKFNRIFSLILCIMLACGSAFAEMPSNTEDIAIAQDTPSQDTATEAVENPGDVEESLDSSEILEWVEKVMEMPELQAQQSSEPVHEELGYAVKKESCIFYYDSNDIENAHLLGLSIIEPLIEGPRGEMIFDQQSELLKLYPNDNPDLVGDRDFAVLYLSTEMPENASYGIVYRDGQRISTIDYYVHEKRPNDMYSNLSLSFEIENNSIESISVYGLMEEISIEDVYQNIKNISEKANNNSYFAYKTSANGAELSPFEREDFIIGGMDLLSITPEKLIEAIGSPDTDEQKEMNEERYHLITWNGINVSFIIKDGKEIFNRLTINDSVLEGPRGTVIGDTFSSVLSRFRSEGNPVNEDNQELLYGEVGGKSYGIANYYPDGMELLYCLTIELDKNNTLEAMADFNFEGDRLSEINIIFQ